MPRRLKIVESQYFRPFDGICRPCQLPPSRLPALPITRAGRRMAGIALAAMPAYFSYARAFLGDIADAFLAPE